jgi:hypothetical protein
MPAITPADRRVLGLPHWLQDSGFTPMIQIRCIKLDHYGCHHTPAALKLRDMHSVYFIFLFCIFVRRFTDSYHTGITIITGMTAFYRR